MSEHEETLETMFREAQSDYAHGDGNLAVKWAFKHARARGLVIVAERELRMLERVEEHCYTRAQYLDATGSEAGYQVALMHLPPPMLANQVRAEMAKATEIAQAAETMTVLLSKLPRAQRQQQKPTQQVRPAVVNGGRR